MKRLRPTLVFLDLFALYIALVLAVIARGTIHGRAIQTAGEWLAAHTFIFIPSAIVSLLALYIAGLYDARTLYDRARVVPLIMYAQVSAGIFSVFFFYFAHTELTPKLTLFLYILFSVILLTVIRIITVVSVSNIRKQKAVYLSPTGISSVERFSQPYAPYMLSQMSLAQFEILPDEKKELFDAIVYDVHLTKTTEDFLKIENLKSHNALCISSESYYEDLYKKVDLDDFDETTFKTMFADKREYAGHFLFRRFLDLFAALTIIPFFIISLPLVLLMNFFFNRGDLFSVQHRIGYLGKKIWVYKLRTMLTTDTGGVMTSEGTAHAHTQSGNGYTKIGNVWRKTRIDEFPQCINLLRGDISIIGPRSDIFGVWKEMTEKIHLYPLRLIVPQGLTGWAQVHMPKPPRTAAEHTERLAYELYYIKHRSILLDISIILKTIKTMIARTGA